jgi:hypothetical protein
MFITAAKVTLVEAIDAAFSALGQSSKNSTIDLVPRSVTIEYPIEEIEWPAIYVQFRPRLTQYTGLYPDEFSPVTDQNNNVIAWDEIRQCYFEGSFDLQILAMTSEERDKIWETVTNLILMGGISPGSIAFFDSIANNDLIAMTISDGQVLQVGDTVSPGTPWSPEELTYEASIRVNCIGEFYQNKYNLQLLPLSDVTVTAEIEPKYFNES